MPRCCGTRQGGPRTIEFWSVAYLAIKSKWTVLVKICACVSFGALLLIASAPASYSNSDFDADPDPSQKKSSPETPAAPDPQSTFPSTTSDLPPASDPAPAVPAPALRAKSEDPELDSNSGDTPPAQPLSGLSADEDEDMKAIEIQEVYPLEHERNALSFEFGLIHTQALDGSSVYYSAGGVRYSLVLGQMIFEKAATTQDSLMLELGAFYYGISGYITSGGNDSYTVVPVTGTLRYTVLLSEMFGFFLYGGAVKNFVFQTTNATEAAKATLAQIFPAAGAGLLIRIGPSWEARAEAGIDMLAGGLVIRF